MTPDEVDGIVLQPLSPALPDELARVERERQAEAVRRFRVGVVGRGHREIHQAVHLGARQRFAAVHAVEKALDAAVVQAGLGRGGHQSHVDLALGEPGLAVLR